MRILLTRPELDSLQTAALLHSLDIDTVICPLFDVVDRAPNFLPDLKQFQGLVFTSKNAVSVFATHYSIPDLPAYCVGEQTANTARRHGFKTVFSADGDLHDLSQLINQKCDPKDGALLRLVQDMPQDELVAELFHFDVTSVILYAMQEKAANIAEVLSANECDGVCFYSPKAASYFAQLVSQSGAAEACRTMTAWCISKATAQALGNIEFQSISIADRPNQQSLITLIRNMHHVD